MKTNSKISAYILRGSTGALLFSCVIVALCSAINLPEQPPKARPPQDNAAFGANGHEKRSLSFADRVAYQRAIEDVYWRHRIWPKERSDPKPSLDAMMSQAQLEKKVEGYLRNSQALENPWLQPLTAEQLQTEMERMASHTKQPDVLRELFEALGSDPFIIAECLARPALAERLSDAAESNSVRADAKSLHSVKMNGSEWHENVQKLAAIFRNRDLVAAAVPPAHGTKAETQGPVTMAAVSANYTLPVIASPSGGCTDDTWTPTTLTNGPTARELHTAVWTGSEMIIWGGGGGGNLNTGGRYNPSTDSWTTTSTTNAPTGRYWHTAVWTGSEMIIWGGYNSINYFNTGGRYNPSTDSWTATSTTNAPLPRTQHTAVWTGSEMIVWGGVVSGASNTGGRYDPSTDSWTATTTTNAPSGRFSHTAVWTGSEMIVWGGGADVVTNTGGRYNPSTNSWIATSTVNAPEARYFHPAVWTGSEMIVWGGAGTSGILNTGGRYNPGTDSWTATSPTNAPTDRTDHTAVWTGSEMIVWGGGGSLGILNTGGRYNPSMDSWTATSTTNAPEARFFHRAVWTGSEMIVWGGFGDTGDLNTGGRYCAAAPSPTPTPTPGQIRLRFGAHLRDEFKVVRLAWIGATSPTVDVYRDGAVLATVNNEGSYVDVLTVRGIYIYQVCEAGTTNCSNEVEVRFRGP
jgi:hypothetical protein